ncbi:MAG: glycosyltransferase N-terminal domain-containing protein [Bacteroidales bacterium]|jgi:3-deoxy-D-manno-octulosonic-acid transferase
MACLYQFFIYFYSAVAKIAALFNPKARLWVDGRKQLVTRIKHEVVTESPLVWFHCASLGEFEQGRPVIEALKKQFPNIKILLTFFSPSGFEVRKNYNHADWVYYLPVDTKKNARELVVHLKPALVIFVKYEFWFNYMDVLYQNKIPTLFLSVIFRPSQHFFKVWGGWFRRQLHKVTFFFVQDELSAELLKRAGINNFEVAGDTRFDRVVELSKQPHQFSEIESFKQNSRLIVGGSTWPVDENLLLEVLKNTSSEIKLLLAPHLVDDNHIAAIVNKFSAFHPVLYTNLKSGIPEQSRVLILNTIGLLSQLYPYTELAYIGGGFGVGIHNLPEAATYGIPVVFGPNHQRFKEANDLKNLGGGFSVNNQKEGVETVLRLLSDEDERKSAGKAAREYIHNHAGATLKIVKMAAEYLS